MASGSPQLAHRTCEIQMGRSWSCRLSAQRFVQSNGVRSVPRGRPEAEAPDPLRFLRSAAAPHELRDLLPPIAARLSLLAAIPLGTQTERCRCHKCFVSDELGHRGNCCTIIGSTWRHNTEGAARLLLEALRAQGGYSIRVSLIVVGFCAGPASFALPVTNSVLLPSRRNVTIWKFPAFMLPGSFATIRLKVISLPLTS